MLCLSRRLILKLIIVFAAVLETQRTLLKRNCVICRLVVQTNVKDEKHTVDSPRLNVRS
jgi:hypothetical protein